VSQAEDNQAPSEAPGAKVNAPSAALMRLAEAYGISISYMGWDREEHRCSSKAIRSALAAMGVASDDDRTCQRESDRLAASRALRVVPPVVVMLAGSTIEVPVHAPRDTAIAATVVLESGETLTPEAISAAIESPDGADGMLQTTVLTLPNDLPLGYHSLEVRVGTSPISATCSVIVTPEHLDLPKSIQKRRPWGLMAHLPSLRSSASWGIGDFADLRDLAILGAYRAGADFVLTTPLHAAEPVPPLTPSPYLPTSRRFVNPLYIRIEDIPETAYLDSADRALIAWLGEAPRESSLNRLNLDRDAQWAAKKAALKEVFKAPLTVARQAAFDAFITEQGQELMKFATWCAIAETRADSEGEEPWPESLSSPTASGVAEFRATHHTLVRFYEWLQWVADEQRADAHEGALKAGMRIGVITDLAIGVHPRGADTWALRGVLARGVEIGAPPDMYNQVGQKWLQPPWKPLALQEAGYVPFRDTVRTALRHAGAVRIDHVAGLFRLWWIPDGCPPNDGVYVRYDFEALVGILVLEATMAGAIVIGEDLGTVEPWVVEYLASRGILGTSVMRFEKSEDGALRSPEDYRAGVLATVTMHDIPPTAAYLAGEHVNLRERLDQLAGPVGEVRAAAERERADMIRILVEHGLLDSDAADDPNEILVGLYRALLASPCALIGVAVPDLVGDVRTQNQPGTDTEYPNWKVPLCDGRGVPVTLDGLFDHPRAQALLAVMLAGPQPPTGRDGAGATSTNAVHEGNPPA